MSAIEVYRASILMEPQERLLSSFDINGVARYIKEKGCRRIVVMCGAGISTSAGIPDFRTPGTGLYSNLERFELPTPNSIFDIRFFREQPRAFYELAKEIWPGKYNPTPSHYFIKLLHDKGLLHRCYTQNIDSLERMAGLPTDKIVAAHGNFDSAHVVREIGNASDESEDDSVDIDELRAAIDKGEEGWQALRREKGGLVKPRIAFFGESLPRRFMQMHKQDLSECDLLIVLGTSLVVNPFASLIGRAARTAPRLLVNNEPAGTTDQWCGNQRVRLDYGFRFHLSEEGQNWRDAWHKGDCDSGCRALASALGWSSDLDALIRTKGAVGHKPVGAFENQSHQTPLAPRLAAAVQLSVPQPLICVI
jgi:NAD-dependent deacetylase sirtuin 2